MKRWMVIGLVVSVLATPAMALIVRIGADPVSDNGWPEGSVEVANHPSRFAASLGPPIGDGLHTLEYRGKEGVLQEVVDLFGRIRWPGLQIVVHDSQNPGFGGNQRVDWTVTLWSPQGWYQYSQILRTLGRGDYRNGDPTYPAPMLTVYAPPQGINWDLIKVPEGVQVSDLRSLSRPQGVTWRGKVFDMITSKPVAGAEILFERSRRPNFDRLFTAQTSPTGVCEQSELPPGVYQITISAAGYVRRVLSMEVPSTGLERMILLSPETTVMGRLIDTEGNPVKGARVSARDTAALDGMPYPAPERVVVTDDRGGFVLSGLPHGTTRFRITDTPMYLLDSLEHQKVPQQELILRVTGTGTVKGVVVDPAGNPVLQGSISVTPPGDPVGKWGGSMNLGKGGAFEFKGVPPGQYYVTKMPSMGMGEDPQAQLIEVKAGQTVEVKYTMR